MYIFIITSADWHGAIGQRAQQGPAGNEMATHSPSPSQGNEG